MNNINNLNTTFFERNKYIILGIFMSSVILLITFALSGYYPLGSSSILKVDLYHQYAPFHEELRYKLLNGESFFYSWEGGLGKEFLSQLAYYTCSPFSLLILLFPVKYLSEAILLFVFLKITLASFTFGYFLKNTFERNTPLIAIFSIMYTFMSFVTSYYWNIMWLDAIYTLPLIMLGIERLVREGSYKTYLFSLILCIFSNFYIAFLVCVFSVFAFLIRVFSEYSLKDEDDRKVIFNRFIKFAILSLLAGGTTMILAVPTIVALLRTETASTTMTNFEIYDNVYQIITAHFSGVEPVVLARNEDLPNVYSGVLTMVLLPLYFFNKNISIKEKLMYTILLLFMLSASIFKQLDFIIHGNHFPANLPHRYTFIYSFFILYLAYKGLMNIKTVNIKFMYICSAIYIAIISFTELILVDKLSEISRVLSVKDIITNIILIIIYCLLITKYQKYNNHLPSSKVTKAPFRIITGTIFSSAVVGFFMYMFIKNAPALRTDDGGMFIFCVAASVILLISVVTGVLIINAFVKINRNVANLCILLLLVVFFETLSNSVTGFLHTSSTNRDAYIQYLEPTEELLAYIKANDNDENKFFRQEFNRFTSINESTLYHYNGFSIFSSVAYGDTSNLIKNLGLASTSNSYRYYDPTPLIDSMFNIKYIMTKDKILTAENYEPLWEFDAVSLYENKYPLSIGFMVDDTILDWETEQPTPFDTQNQFMHKAINTNYNIINLEEIDNFISENVEISQKDLDDTSFTYVLHDESNISLIPTVRASLVNSETQRLFIYIDSPKSRRFKYTLNGVTNDREISTGNSLIDLGIVQAGEIVEIEFSLDRKGSYEKTYSKTGEFSIYAGGFDTELYAELYKQLDDEILIVNDYNSKSLHGNIEVKNDGIMFTSIPYDEAFKVYIDGLEGEIIKIGEGLVGVPLESGFYEIEFKYYPKGFNLGAIISMLSLFGIFLYSRLENKSKI